MSDSKNILILGAGLVTRPMVNYLLDHQFKVTIATRTVSKAENLIAGRANGIAVQLDAMADSAGLDKTIQESNVVVSLLPATHHVIVARHCLEHNKHLVTTSYVSPQMQELDAAVQKSGLLFLNECGLDPGIDHMSAMKTIHEVQDAGGKVASFASYCGGLPAVKNNNNPFGYKFSWSPAGVVRAGTNSARFLKNGEQVDIDGKELFEHYAFIEIPGVGVLEAYPNRNSLGYIEKYHLEGVRDMYRGTLRNIGHCETWRHLVRLGLLDNEKQYDFTQVTPAKLLAELVGQNDGKDLMAAVAEYLQLPRYSVLLKKLAWLGWGNDALTPLQQGTAMDMLVYLLNAHLQYAQGEVDLVILQHEFIAEYPDRREKIIATLVDEGIADGDSAMARTVSLPAAIAVRLLLENKIPVTGVVIPVHPDIYQPILAELQNNDIVVREQSMTI